MQQQKRDLKCQPKSMFEMPKLIDRGGNSIDLPQTTRSGTNKLHGDAITPPDGFKGQKRVGDHTSVLRFQSFRAPCAAFNGFLTVFQRFKTGEFSAIPPVGRSKTRGHTGTDTRPTGHHATPNRAQLRPIRSHGPPVTIQHLNCALL